MIKVMSVFGTRPEAIKMAPLVKELEKTPEIEENTVSFVEENEISDVENESGTILQTVEKILFKKSDLKGKKKESKVI